MKPSRKIIVMSMIPLVGLFLFLAYIIAGQIHVARQAVSLRQLCGLAVKTGALVHELQTERGKSVGFMAAGGGVSFQELKERRDLKELFFISAKTGDGVEELVREFEARLKEGPPFFEGDIYTELPVRFLAAEAIREQAMELLHQEVPYGVAVEIVSFEEKPQITVIKANIVVDRESHKSMVIGKGGQMIKKIGTRAREKIEFMMADQKVFLELFVRVEPDWTRNPSKMAELGYS